MSKIPLACPTSTNIYVFFGMQCIRLILIIGWAFLMPFLASSQSKQLSVYKANGQLAHRFYEGDRIQIKLSEHGWLSGEIEWLLNDSLIVAGLKIGLPQIKAVRRFNAFAVGSSVNLGVAGVLWPGIVAINGLTANQRPLITRNALISSAVMLGSAAVLFKIGMRTYKTTEAGRLRIIHFNFQTPTSQP